MRKPLRIYVASSWKNDLQPEVVRRLREANFEVYDFRNPEGSTGFHWSEIDEDYEDWTTNEYLMALRHAYAEEGFRLDFTAMKGANWCVLVLPAGRSAHLEAGYFCGHPGKGLIILLDARPNPAELMYKMADVICTDIDQLVEFLCDEEARRADPKYTKFSS